jgi:predicted ester cyclase
VWGTGDVERLAELVAPEVVHHDPYDPHGADGLLGMKRTIEMNRSAFPDMRLIVEDQSGRATGVVTRWRGEMAHAGHLAGRPADRPPGHNHGHHDQFEDGKIVEAWRSMDTLGLLRGIGALCGD